MRASQVPTHPLCLNQPLMLRCPLPQRVHVTVATLPRGDNGTVDSGVLSPQPQPLGSSSRRP